MAINPETQYPGKIAPSTPDYPYGAARNITVAGDGTGTPWEAALVNDLFGFQQALLSEAETVPSGTPETATTSQYLNAIKQGFVVKLDTLAAAVARKGLLEGMAVTITNRETGDGVYCEFIVVLTSGVTPNGKNVVQTSVDPTLSLLLVEGSFSFSDRYGVPIDASGDVSGDLKEWFDHCSATGRTAFLAPKRHLVNLSIDMPSDLNLTGVRGKSWLDGTSCDAVNDPAYLFGGRDAVLAGNDKDNIHIERVRFTYPSVEAFGGQTLCGAVRFYGCRDSSVRLCDIAPTDLNSDINLSATSVDNGLNGSSQRVKADAITFAENNILCHSGACVIKGRNPSGEPNDTQTSAISFINNNVKNTQTSGGLSTTGIIKVDIYSRDINIRGNNCDGNGLVVGFIQCEEGTENVAIVGNVIWDCATAGIKLFDGQGAVAFKNITVTGNALRNAGIFANHGGSPAPISEGVVISGNTINGWQTGGDGTVAAISFQFMQLSDGVVIADNVISGSASGGIFVRAPNPVITGNVVNNAVGDVISIQDAARAIVCDNRVLEGARSLVLNNSPEVTVGNNSFKSTVANGQGMVYQSGAAAGGCVFTGNVFDQNAADDVLFTNGVTNGDNLLVGNNLISGGFNRPQDNNLANNIIAGAYTP